MNNVLEQYDKSTETYDETTPVLIVGGSLVGLSTALFLARQGTPCLLVERHRGISPFSRASGFNQRTMEIYHAVGAEEAIRAASPPFDNLSIMRVESLAGKELDNYTQSKSDFEQPISPAKFSFITQDLLEPVLRAQAEALGADLRFNTRLVSLAQDADGVSAVIRNQDTGAERTVRARYLVAADGNDSPIRRQLGIGTHGYGVLAHQLFINFKANLLPALRGRHIFFCYVVNEKVQGAVAAFPGGQAGMLNIPYHPEQGERPEDYAGERGLELIRAAVGIPDLAVEIGEMRTWDMAAIVADRIQQGRVFLVGDAAHVMPPTGGYGANTGISDAYNLAWKLVLVVKEDAGAHLLATYEPERLPVANLTVDQAFALSIERIAPHLANEHTPKPVRYDLPVMGYMYHSTAVLSEAEVGDTAQEDPFNPTGRPGTRAAHIPLLRPQQGDHAEARLSTIDLFKSNFVLLAGSDARAWCEAARYVSEVLGLKLDVYRIGESGDLRDIDSRFLTSYGITPAGAVLVRPDGFIAWRAHAASNQPKDVFEQALSQLLSLQ
ncbi:MAG TPA: FAD-dependent monooxygenase [Ktedonosporobacter sp.]|nr:FAD-dependent monooxygenase [Ktedonosporobacter sp.]